MKRSKRLLSRPSSLSQLRWLRPLPLSRVREAKLPLEAADSGRGRAGRDRRYDQPRCHRERPVPARPRGLYGQRLGVARRHCGCTAGGPPLRTNANIPCVDGFRGVLPSRH